MARAAESVSANVRAFPRERCSDAELVAAVAAGDRDALTVVWRRHAAAVRATLYATLGPDHAVDDLVQDVFFGLLRNAGHLEQPSALKSYLLGAAIRISRFERRTRGRRSRWMSELKLAWSGRRQEPLVEPRDALRALRSILDRLPERSREAFVLRYVEELPPGEVARALGVAEATAKRAIAHGRDRVLTLAQREPALADYLEPRQGGAH